MEFSRQEYWNGLPFPTSRDLPNPGMEPMSPALQVDSLLFEPPGKPTKWEVWGSVRNLGLADNMIVHGASLVTQLVKNPPAMQETSVQFLGWEDPWRRKWQPIPVFLLGESHGQRSLEGYSSWGHKELDVT